VANVRLAANLSFTSGLVDTISSSPAAQAGLPADNLLNRDRYKTCRITPSSNSATLTCTLLADQSVGVVGLFGLNLTASATGRCRLLDASDTELWDSTTADLYPAGAGHTLPQANRGVIWWADQNYLTVRKIEITLTDTASYFDLARLAFGAVWSPVYNPGYSSIGWGWKNTAEYYRTQGGTGRASPRDAYRSMQWQLLHLSENDRNTLALYLQQAGQSMIISQHPEDGGQLEADNQMLCHLIDSQDLIPIYADAWGMSANFEEI